MKRRNKTNKPPNHKNPTTPNHTTTTKKPPPLKASVPSTIKTYSLLGSKFYQTLTSY